jgi:hypothetical protein
MNAVGPGADKGHRPAAVQHAPEPQMMPSLQVYSLCRP